MHENIIIRGQIDVQIEDVQTGVTYGWSQPNLVTIAGRNAVVSGLAGESALAKLSEISVGTGSTVPALNDSALETEVFRDTVTAIFRGSGFVQAKLFIGVTDANGEDLIETGLWVGNTLFARALLKRILEKTVDKAATITWTISVGQAS